MSGTRRDDPVTQRVRAERRFFELATAVRAHEASLHQLRRTIRLEDKRLHQRLRQIAGEPLSHR